ncbi:ferredoxin reductase [Humibacter sp. RRB41]|uniref:ferredoxin reductase n=1 Tax=Humibacter sp. RRB41 TaxID=2919946 RepID=UPI0027E36AFB|nr:ferredoxin reductase [Humibacter sp. RRB41]
MIAHAAWHVATVSATHPETPSARRIVLDIPDWPGNLAGQHVDVRLTAEDGYQASRSYSIASSGDAPSIELAVDRVASGEVSPYLVDDLMVGDQLEVRGPLGGWFVWRPDPAHRPVQLIAGGSGVVPIAAIVRAHRAALDVTPLRLLYAVRTPDDVFFRSELDREAADPGPTAVHVDYVFSRRAPDGAPRPAGRLTRELLGELVLPPQQNPLVFVCGSTPFVERVLGWLKELGHEVDDVRAERFGGA